MDLNDKDLSKVVISGFAGPKSAPRPKVNICPQRVHGYSRVASITSKSICRTNGQESVKECNE